VRTSRAVAIAASVSTVLLAYFVIAWAQVTPIRERGTDFSASYVAALLLRDGQGAQLYDQQAEHSRHLTLLPPGTVINLPFITPPTTALLALPLTVLDPGTAFRVWSVIELILLALAAWVAIRAGPWPSGSSRAARSATLLMATAAGGTYALLLLGQIDGVAALGLAVAYAAWRKNRPAAAGFWMAHVRSDRQPQPMHESRPSRSALRALICSSSRPRHPRESRAQSLRLGARPLGSLDSACSTSSRLNPTLRAARMKASRLSTLRS